MLKNIKEYVKEQKAQLKDRLTDQTATLAIIQVGNVDASNRYVKHKINDCKEVGITPLHVQLPDTISQESLEHEIKKVIPVADGIIVQFPLPPHLDKQRLINLIPAELDVDGFRQDSPYDPCTPKGIVDYLAACGYDDLSGLNVTIIGRSDIVGKPLAAMMTNKNATVTLCHSKTKDLYPHLQTADIIVCAVGRANFLDCSDIPSDKIIIDVGINLNKEGKLVGDCCNTIGKQVTPVPGGVGLLTRLALITNIKEKKDMTNEFNFKKVDGTGRVTIPKVIRERMGIHEGDELEIFTTNFDGRNFVCFGKTVENAKYKMAAEVLAELGLEVPSELKEKI